MENIASEKVLFSRYEDTEFRKYLLKKAQYYYL